MSGILTKIKTCARLAAAALVAAYAGALSGATATNVAVSFGADYRTATVVATVDTAGSYKINGGEAVEAVEADGVYTVTFENVPTGHAAAYDSFAYAITDANDAAVASGSTTIADSTAWIASNSTTPASGGVWKDADGADTTVTYTDGKADIEEGYSFAANQTSASDIVTIETVASFGGINAEDVSNDSQAAIRVGGTENDFYFEALIGVDTWSRLSVAGVAVDLDKAYTIVITLNYVSRTYTISVDGVLASATIADESTSALPIAKAAATGVASVDFAGAGALKSLKGDTLEGNMVADANGTKYATVADAIAAVNGNTAVKPLSVLHTADLSSTAGWKVSNGSLVSTTATWTNAGGDSKWNNAANWDWGVVPDADCTVVFNTDADVITETTGSVGTVAAMVVNANVSLQYNAALASYTAVTVTGDVTGEGKLTLNRAGLYGVDNGSQTIGCDLAFYTDGSNDSFISGGTWTVNGEVSGSGLFKPMASFVFNNAVSLDGGRIDRTVSGASGNLTFNGAVTLENASTIKSYAVAYNNALSISAGSLVSIGSSTQTFGETFTLSGAGTIRFDTVYPGGTTNPNPTRLSNQLKAANWTGVCEIYRYNSKMNNFSFNWWGNENSTVSVDGINGYTGYIGQSGGDSHVAQLKSLVINGNGITFNDSFIGHNIYIDAPVSGNGPINITMNQNTQSVAGLTKFVFTGDMGGYTGAISVNNTTVGSNENNACVVFLGKDGEGNYDALPTPTAYGQIFVTENADVTNAGKWNSRDKTFVEGNVNLASSAASITNVTGVGTVTANYQPAADANYITVPVFAADSENTFVINGMTAGYLRGVSPANATSGVSYLGANPYINATVRLDGDVTISNGDSNESEWTGADETAGDRLLTIKRLAGTGNLSFTKDPGDTGNNAGKLLNYYIAAIDGDYSGTISLGDNQHRLTIGAVDFAEAPAVGSACVLPVAVGPGKVRNAVGTELADGVEVALTVAGAARTDGLALYYKAPEGGTAGLYFSGAKYTAGDGTVMYAKDVATAVGAYTAALQADADAQIEVLDGTSLADPATLAYLTLQKLAVVEDKYIVRAVARIGTVAYATLGDAVAAASADAENPSTIVLLAEQDDGVVALDKTIVLDDSAAPFASRLSGTGVVIDNTAAGTAWSAARFAPGWTGTFTINWTTETTYSNGRPTNSIDFNNYGISGSTVKLAQDFTGYMAQSGNTAVEILPNIVVDATLTIGNGYAYNTANWPATVTFNSLSVAENRTMDFNFTPGDGNSYAHYAIQVLDNCKGAITVTGPRNRVAIESINTAGMPTANTAIANISVTGAGSALYNSEKLAAATNPIAVTTKVEFNNQTIDYAANAVYATIGGTPGIYYAVAKIGNSYYATYADAVAAYQDGDEIDVLDATAGNVPAGWEFAENSTKLVKQTFTLTVAAADNATVSVAVNGEEAGKAAGEYTVEYGDSAVVTYTAAEGWKLASGSAEQVFENIAADCAAAAPVFERDTIDITVPSATGLSVHVAQTKDGVTSDVAGEGGVYTVQAGATVVITYSADGAYVLEGESVITIADIAAAPVVTAPVATPAVAMVQDNVEHPSPVYYTSLESAIENVPDGYSVVLLDDVALAGTIVIDTDKGFFIDLNGHNIAATGCRALWIKAGDVTISGTGVVSANKGANAASFANTSSVIRVGDSAANTKKAAFLLDDDATVSSDHCYGITVFGKNATPEGEEYGISLAVGGTVSVTGTASAISGNGSKGLSAVDIEIQSTAVVTAQPPAEYTAGDVVGVYFPSEGSLMIRGFVAGPTAVYVKAGELDIAGDAMLAGTGAAAEYRYNGNGAYATGDALVLDSCGYPAGATLAAEVAGGQFVSVNANGVAAYAKEGCTAATGFVSGGVFSSAVAEEYCADGFIPESTTVEGVTTYGVTAGYKVTFVDDDDDETVLYAVNVKTGATPAYVGDTPSKADTAEYTYTFAGWTPEIVAVADAAQTYKATYTATKRSYTVTWIVEGVETTETYEYGATPSREDPVKAATAQYTYTFAGWTPEVVAVTGDAVYTAQFSQTAKEYTLTIPDVTGATATVTVGDEEKTAPYKFAYGTEVTVTWTAATGYSIASGATEEITIDGDKTAAEPGLEAKSVDFSSAEFEYTGYNIATVVVPVSITGGADGIGYKLTVNGAEYTDYTFGTTRSTTTGFVTFTGVAVPEPGVEMAYTITTTGGTVETATGTGVTYVGDLTSGWISATVAAPSATGSWASEPAVEGGRLSVVDNTYTADTPSAGEVVVVKAENICFTSVGADEVEGDTPQGAIKIGRDGEGYTFMIYEGGEFKAVSAAGVAADPEAEYTVEAVLNYATHTYTVSINGKALGYVGDNEETVTGFALAGNKSNLQSITFSGQGSFESIEGEYYTAYAAKDANGVKYATLQEAMAAIDAGTAAMPVTVLHTATAPAGWTIDANGCLVRTAVAATATATVTLDYFDALQDAIAAALASEEEGVYVKVLKDVSGEAATLPNDSEVTIDFNGQEAIELACVEGGDYKIEKTALAGSDTAFVYASRSWATYTINYNYDSEMVTLANATATVSEKDAPATVTFTATPAASYKITGVTGADATENENEYTLTVSGDATVTITAERDTVDVTVPKATGFEIHVTANGATVEGTDDGNGNMVYTVPAGSDVVATYSISGAVVTSGTLIHEFPAIGGNATIPAALAPTYVAAVAQAGGKYYATFAEAVAAATAGETVTLLADIPLAATIAIAKNLTIDLGGHNITANDCRAIWVKGGNVAIAGEGVISTVVTPGTAFASSSSVIRVGGNDAPAAFTLGEHATVTSDYCYGVTYFGTQPQTVVIDGVVAVTGSQAAISGNGTKTLAATTLTVNGTVSATQDYAIYNPQQGTTVINGTVTGLGGIEVKAGAVTVNPGATITATAQSQSHAVNNNGTSTTGYAIASVGNVNYHSGEPVVEIAGGTINGKAIVLADTAAAGNGTITAVSDEIAVPEGYRWEETETEGVYTLAEIVAHLEPMAVAINYNCYGTATIVDAPAGATFGWTVSGPIKIASGKLTSTLKFYAEGINAGAATATVAVTNGAEVATYTVDVTVRDVAAVVDGVEYAKAGLAAAAAAAIANGKTLQLYTTGPKVTLEPGQTLVSQAVCDRNTPTPTVSAPAGTAELVYSVVKTVDSATKTYTYTLASDTPAVMFTAAADNSVEYLDASFKVSKAGTYKLLKSFSRGQLTVGNVAATLDLNGQTMTSTVSGAKGAIYVDTLLGSASLAIVDSVGGGKVVAENCYTIWANRHATVAIEAGEFTGSGDVVYLSNAASSVAISGGVFKMASGSAAYMLNMLDSARGTITVTGGKFYGFDPADNTAEGANTDFVADGYVSVDRTEYFEVVELVETALAPGESKTFDSRAQAEMAVVGVADAVKTAIGDGAVADYKARFEIAIVEEDGKFTATCAMTAAETTALEAEIDEFVSQMTFAGFGSGDAVENFTGAVPGLYYYVVASDTVGGTYAEEGERVIADAEGRVALVFPAAGQGKNARFYKIAVDAAPAQTAGGNP